MAKQAAFIGMGVMGYPMARHLKTAGYQMRVFNRSFAKAERWANEHGGIAAQSPAEAAEGCEFVMACVGNDTDVEAVTSGPDGAFHSMPDGACFIDHTTASSALAERVYKKAKEHGLNFLDAPVSGGQAGAENGKLTIMVGGDAEAFARVEPVIRHYALAITHMGPAGCGQLTKMVNQICIAGLVQGLSEGLAFAQCSGLDAQLALQAVSQGAASSWQMANRGKTMLDDEFEFGFAVDHMRKDLGICLETARRVNAQLPVTALVDQFYAQLQNMGGNRWDTSSLIRRLR